MSRENSCYQRNSSQVSPITRKLVCSRRVLPSVLSHHPLVRLNLRDPRYPDVCHAPLDLFAFHLPTCPVLHALPIDKYIYLPSVQKTVKAALEMKRKMSDLAILVHCFGYV